MDTEGKIARISAVWYLGISAGLSLVFYIITTMKGYPLMARYGGAIWVFILTVIITMPFIIPWIKKKYQ
ncbi:MAG: hypothetical protein ACYC21_07935 [Eubacteriales bacterium]